MANTRGKRKEIEPVDEAMEKVDTTTSLANSKKTRGSELNAEGFISGIVNCQNLNVRKEPALGATILKIIQKGAKVTVIDSVSDAWYKVRVGNIETGFCMKEFINVPAK